MDMRRGKLHDVAKKVCASRQRTWFLWIGRTTVGGENVKNRLPPKPLHWFTWVTAATGVFQVGLFTGKSAGCPAFLPVGRGGEGGNGLPQWSQSRPCNHNYISRKPLPCLSADRDGELHIQNIKSIME